MLTELINFAEECLEFCGDIPVFMKVEDDDLDDVRVAEEMILIRDPKSKKRAFIINDFENNVPTLKPKLKLVKSDNGINR